jgi:hypothetical protein
MITLPRLVAVVGSRDPSWELRETCRTFIRRVAEKYPDTIIVSGGARGIDSDAERLADILGLGLISYRPGEYIDTRRGRKAFTIYTVTHGETPVEVVERLERREDPPLFDTYGQAAYHRNRWIVEDGRTFCAAFWDGQSRGTQHSIDIARELNRPHRVYIA